MDKLLSNGFDVGSLPEDYIFPPELRPGDLKVPFSTNIPVIDLSEAQNGDRTNTIQKIINASEEFGFFQVHSIITYFSSIINVLWARHKIYNHETHTPLLFEMSSY